MTRKYFVVDHNPLWMEQFQTEKTLLKEIFGRSAVNIHHIGSTAIPSIKAKPIIDILIEVTSLSEVDMLNPELGKLGYEAKGENGIAERRYFQKGGIKRSHHLHCFLSDHPEVKRHLNFRDYLIANPEKAMEYSGLKHRLSVENDGDREAYLKGKEPLIKQFDKEAEIWFRKQN
ncbi:GrpB family protein [Bacillus tianshenii]|uniref:GrpB family protein n=1 Tax=Sutcliffiella tianshenii TaxID=1463404 RepID=UPI001CD71CB7|nr:GrpB family protein [Bacillus tianshenii]MCA1321687.1 GrpB family protein [Bacillus tianshenii]